MIVLGLHYGHDGSACIIKHGKLASAVSSERVTRKKKFHGVTQEVIDYVLEEAGVTFDEIDHIALSDYDTHNSHDTLALSKYLTSGTVFGNDVEELYGVLRGKHFKVFVIPHHLAHSAGAYYTSNFDKAWCFSMDSSGYKVPCNSLVAYGEGNKITAKYCPGLMVGWSYAVFTHLLGLGNPVHKAGSTMGLASYGTPSDAVVENIEKYVRYSYCNDGDDFEQKSLELWKEISGTNRAWEQRESSSVAAQNIAASIQYIFEQSILDCVKAIENGDTTNLCLSGGSMLNCNANSLIRIDTQFKNLHHFPACGDDGIAVGAALYVAHHIFDDPRQHYNTGDVCYLGKTQETAIEPDYEQIAELLDNGKIVAWFMGRSEYGPRALGHRSILADPRDFHKREILNFVVKNREWFRPFAPMVLEEDCSEWFDFDGASPYMLYTAQVKRPRDIPAITHIDGTARMQTVNESTNLEIYKLLKEFKKRTGVPVLINTSLNGRDEPILETVDDALKFFETSAVDAIVINGKLIKK